MIRSIHKVLLLALYATATFAAGSVSADDLNLPDMGSPADAILSQNDEAQIGRAIMRDIRQSGQVVEDPFITEYVNEIGNRIVRNPMTAISTSPSSLLTTLGSTRLPCPAATLVSHRFARSNAQ